MNEGVAKTPQGFYSFEGWGGKTTQWYAMTPRGAFAALIDKISGKGTWESNPYVFVYEFELVKQTAKKCKNCKHFEWEYNHCNLDPIYYGVAFPETDACGFFKKKEL